MCWKERGCAHLLESHGLTVTYDIDKDQHRSNASKLKDQKRKREIKEREDEKRNKELDAKAKEREKKEAAAKAAAGNVLNGGTVVGKNGKDATKPTEAATSIQNNLNQQ